MTNNDQERWQRVKDQLRKQLGEDVFSSWFGRMELEAVDNGAVRLSVPTRFLRTWIQAHYSEQVLGKWQAEEASTPKGERGVPPAAGGPPMVKENPSEPMTPARNGHEGMNGAETRAS